MLFRSIKDVLEGRTPREVTNKERVEMCLRHYELAIKYDGEYKAIREMRKHASWYIKGLPRCTEVRNEINVLDDSSMVMKILKEYSEQI